MSQNRQPKGIPVGGQYAVSTKGAASGVTLDDGTVDWGTVSVTEGSRTPWGEAQMVERPASGIAVVSTDGHGGVKLSRERNASIPAPLRNASGWYEEDCESNIVGMYHPEAFPHIVERSGTSATVRDFERSVKDWFPDQYTKATGNEVTLDESGVLRRRVAAQSKAEFRAAHADEFVTLGNGDTHADWIPDGYAVTCARRDTTGEERHFLVPREDVIRDRMWGEQVLIDPRRHHDVTDIATLAPDRPWAWARDEHTPLHGESLGIDYSALTSTQATRARAELAKMWRFTDGEGGLVTESMGEHLARVGVVGKHPHVDGDKVTYSVDLPNSRVVKVSKATYDALAGVPDISTPVDKAYVAQERARAAYERERARLDLSTGGEAKRQRAEAKYVAAADAYKALAEERDADGRAWQAERDQMRRDAFAAFTQTKGLDFGDES